MPRTREARETGHNLGNGATSSDFTRERFIQETQKNVSTYDDILPSNSIKKWFGSLEKQKGESFKELLNSLATQNCSEAQKLAYVQKNRSEEEVDLFTTYTYWLDPSGHPSMCPKDPLTPEDRTEQIVVLAHHMAKFDGNQYNNSFRSYMRNNPIKNESDWEMFNEEFGRVLTDKNGEITKSDRQKLFNIKRHYTIF